MSEPVTISLPWPDKRLHAHASGHWRSKTTVTREARQVARFATIKVLAAGCPWKSASVGYHFRLPDRRPRDIANLIQSMKPSVDGVVDAGLIVDDNLFVLAIAGVSWSVERESPGVDLIFTNTEPDNACEAVKETP